MHIPKRVVIFAAIGVINTLIDFSLYLILLHVFGNILVANVLATSTALVVSFVLNSRFTFRVGKLSVPKFMAFLGVTLFGLWVLQTGIIYVLTPIVNQLPQGIFTTFGDVGGQLEKLIPKLCATVVTLVWNYVWYSKVIFKDAN